MKEKKKRAEEYKKQKLELMAQRRQMEEMELARQREELKETIEKNRPNVEQRYQLLQEKEHERTLKEVCILSIGITIVNAPRCYHK